MLGELIYEEAGTITGTRVLEPGGEESLVEVDLRSEGTIQGVKETTLWTYWSATRADGSIYGEGDGIMTTEHGDIIRLIGSGTAAVGAPGSGISYRGSIYFHTNSDRFSHLNSIMGAHEHEVAPDGSATVKVWEWK